MLKNKDNCSGCSACFAVCPVGAIEMKYDEEGFKYPEINKELCTNCHLCEKTCEKICNEKISESYPKYYAAWASNDIRLRKSSSGGFFHVAAENVLDENGDVFGAAFDDEFNVCHISIDKKEDLDKLKGSKYVQSDLKNSFKECKNKLENGKLCHISLSINLCLVNSWHCKFDWVLNRNNINCRIINFF